MGDTGSLLIGLVCAILAIEFIELHNVIGASPYKFSSVPAVTVGILILPLFDTLRVFVTRVFQGRSPLHADRSHIHHLIIDCGFSHMQSTGILVLTNIFFIALAIQFQNIGTLNLLILLLVVAIVLSTILYFFSKRKKPDSTFTEA